jgi:hypothetical protein
MILVFGATLFFMLLHELLSRRFAGQPFHLLFKLSRGADSVILTAIGFYALLRWFPLWPQAFLRVDPPGSDAYYLICFVTGHFVADFLLLAFGLARHRSTPRKDLMAHHLLGLVGAWVVFHYGVGYELFAVALTTEMMPVTSGFAALAALRERPALERLSVQLRLLVLCGWRLPFWALVTAIVLRDLRQPEPEALMLLARQVTLGCMAVVLVLDGYWVGLCLRALRAPTVLR